MAKVIGPLYSLEAKGQFGKTIVFNRLGNQNIAKRYTVSRNPMTDAQTKIRIGLAVTAIINRRIKATNWRLQGVELTIIEWANREKRINETWASSLARLSLGPNNMFYKKTEELWSRISDSGTYLFNEEARSAIPGLENYTYDGITVEAGFMLFLNQYMLVLSGYNQRFDVETPTVVLSG